MNPRHPIAPLLLFAAALAAAPAPGHALIVTSDPPADAPADPALEAALDAIGKWGINAAAVAVADGWVLTTRHQDNFENPVNRFVDFGDDRFTALAGDPDSVITFGDNVDLRLVRAVDAQGRDAEFDSTLSAFTGAITQGTRLTLAGFGPTRGSEESDGFDYSGTLNNKNPLLSGTNDLFRERVNAADSERYAGMAVLDALFDERAPGVPVDEATIAPGDSGGFWLVGNAATGYDIAGLSHAVESRQNRADNPEALQPSNPVSEAFFTQLLVAVDARPFADRINTIPEPAAAGLLLAGLAGLRRRRPA